MINSISSGMPMQRPPENNTPLSDENTALIKETLEQFDADNLTDEDMLSIVNTFAEAGIQPSKAMAELMAESGFDAKAIGDFARSNNEGAEQVSQRRPPPPPAESDSQFSTLLDYLEEQLEGRELNSLDDNEKSTLIAQIVERFGLPDEDSLVNLKA